MLSTGIWITLAVRLARDERAGFRFTDLAPTFESPAVLEFDIPHYNNSAACPATYTVRLGDLPGDPLPQSLKKHLVLVF
jgi:hypothetical protein